MSPFWIPREPFARIRNFDIYIYIHIYIYIYLERPLFVSKKVPDGKAESDASQQMPAFSSAV